MCQQVAVAAADGSARSSPLILINVGWKDGQVPLTVDRDNAARRTDLHGTVPGSCLETFLTMLGMCVPMTQRGQSWGWVRA